MRLPGTLNLKGTPQSSTACKPIPAAATGPRRSWTASARHPRRYRAGGSNGLVRASSRMARPITRPLAGHSADMVAEAHAELSGGIEPHSWFDILPDADKDEVLRQMLDFCPDLAKGGRDGWIRVLMAASRSGAPNAERNCAALVGAGRAPQGRGIRYAMGVIRRSSRRSVHRDSDRRGREARLRPSGLARLRGGAPSAAPRRRQRRRTYRPSTMSLLLAMQTASAGRPTAACVASAFQHKRGVGCGSP